MSEPERSVVGRGIVYTLFGIVATYLCVTMLGSVVVDLYGKPPVDTGLAQMSLRQRSWCTRNLIALRDELEGQVTLELQHPRTEGDPLGRWRVWDEGWRDRFERAKSGCATVEDSAFTTAYGILEQIHTTYGESVESMIDVRTERMRALATAIQRLRWAR